MSPSIISPAERAFIKRQAVAGVSTPKGATMNHDGAEGEEEAEQVEALLATPDLADALESDQFRRFLDQIPIAIVVSELKGTERIAYANPEFEQVSGQTAAELVGKPWSILSSRDAKGAQRKLGAAIVESSDFVGTFRIERTGHETTLIAAYSNLIENDGGTPCYRLAALVKVGEHEEAVREESEQRIREKDIALFEIQHRVKNNLQMITALIRIEARNVRDKMDTAPFDRLAGRIEALHLLYALLSHHGHKDEIDLGVYLSEIASAVLRAHAVEGIRLDLKVDAYPVSVNLAMPTGLAVNELLTNAIKHAFVGRDGGTIVLHSLCDAQGCRIVVADDGVGLPEGVEWPKPGKLSALIIQSLCDNAKANLKIQTSPDQGTRVTITFTRAAAAPTARGQAG